MALLWCAVSAHGYGHAAQVIPVLNALTRRRPDLRIILRTEVPRSYFEGRLHGAWSVSVARQDIGCIQHGPLEIDEAATWRAHEEFEDSWAQCLDTEAAAMRRDRPDLVLSDISYLAVAAAREARIPVVALSSLSWDMVLEFMPGAARPAAQRLIAAIRERYAGAEVLIRAAPALPCPAFSQHADVAPIADPLPPDRAALCKAVGAMPDERVVLIGFGGVSLTSLPTGALDAMDGYRFILAGVTPAGARRIVPLDALALPFRTVLSSCDVVITKPGYSTTVEAVASGIPTVYVRRFNFADEETLVQYLRRYGRSAELSRADFEAGRWRTALEAALHAPPPAHTAPLATGAEEAAELLGKYV